MHSKDNPDNHQMSLLQKQNSRLPSQLAGRHPTWWHSPLIGYLCSIMLIGAAFLLNWLEEFIHIRGYFVGILFVIGTFFICWVWGTGPAILAMVVEVLCLDYLVIVPIRTFSFYQWPGIIPFVPFIVIQILIMWVIARQKNYELQLLHAQQELSLYAERVAESNRRLAESNVQLEQADRIKDQFLSMASHELKTPVTSIHGYVQLLMRRMKKQSPLSAELFPIRDILIKVDEQTKHLIGLISDLLDMNSLRLGKMPFQLALCDLCCLCKEVVEGQRPLTDHLIESSFFPNRVVVQADKERLFQVVTNLVTNAIKYSPVDAVIRVGVRQMSTEAIISVQNDGPALSQEQQEIIFEPFQRSFEVQSSGVPGWGLGLAISQSIVEQHYGRLWMESVEGKGTTFFVALPLPNASESTAS